ncbi:MAG: metal-dependent hydrolase [Syntrophobacterales bacterium]|jgi:inner membrane protein
MDPLTHIATGVAISQFVPAPSRGGAVLAGLLFALLPDLDYVMRFSNPLAYMKHHRGFSHSLVAFLIYILLGAALGRLVGGPRWFRPLLFIGFLVLASHLFLDWTTSYGTQLLNPFTRAKFSLDWVFIIDPYLTALLVLGALAAIWSAGWARILGATCLSLAGAYILLCGFNHHRALNLARQIFPSHTQANTTVAALPQPFSPWHWLLMAVAPGEIRQAFVDLPYWPVGHVVSPPPTIPVQHKPRTYPQVPPATYRPPEALQVYRWQAAPSPDAILPPEARWFLDTYLDFSRFPLLVANDHDPDGITLTWLDLRFSVPGRSLPFVLELHLDRHGRLAGWNIGGVKLPFEKSPAPSSRPG